MRTRNLNGWLLFIFTALLCLAESTSACTAAELLIADRLSHSVYRYSTSGSYLGTLIDKDLAHLFQPTGVQVSPDLTKLYVASSQTNSVVIYDYDYGAGTATYSQTITENLRFPNSILFRPSGDKFYVSNYSFRTVDGVPVPVGVAQFNADGSSAGPNLIPSNLLSSGLEWAEDEELLVGGWTTPGLISKSTGGVSALANYLTPPPALNGASGLLRVGTDLYVTAMTVPAVYKFDITGTPAVDESFTVDSLDFPQAIMLAPDGNGLLVGVLGSTPGSGHIARLGFGGAADPITVFAPHGNGTNGFLEATAMVLVVPEPSTLVLMGVAVSALAVFATRRVGVRTDNP